ncbi:cytoplasmic protein [Desulfobacterota bacterium AH_259_B03_O07]|nr:cytoplasmic protein [Desulfobacterota bacterium AH_259_B03_O07]
MKNLVFLIALSITLSFMLYPNTSMAQDPLKVSPEIYKILIENDRVRVIEYRSKPGQRDALHSHPQRVAYVLTPVKLKVTAQDGSSRDLEAKPGDIYWLEPVTHYTENIGNNEANILIFEIKEPPQKRSTIPLKQTDPWGSPW